MLKFLILFAVITSMFSLNICQFVGGKQDIDLKDPEVYNLVKSKTSWGVDFYNKWLISNANRKPVTTFALYSIVSAQKQIVAGVLYFVKAALKTTKCLSNRCPIFFCEIQIVETPWLANSDKMKLKSLTWVRN